MGYLTAALINLRTDKLTAARLAGLGSSGSGLGLGDGTFGLSLKSSDLATIVGASADPSIEAVEAPLVTQWPLAFETSTQFPRFFFRYFQALDQLGLAAQPLNAAINSLDTLMYFYNVTTGPFAWACLAAPDWRQAFIDAHNGSAPSPLNVYFECLTGASWGGTTFTNALAKDVKATGTDTVTAGYVIDPTKFAGGFAYLNVTALGGNGVVTVTGLDQAGNAETWTVTVTTTGRVLLVPSTHAYSLITKVTPTTGIATASGITSMTATVEANRPAGRTNPPV